VNPCKNCKDRELYCHSKCEKQERIEYENKRKKIKKSKKQQSFVSSAMFDCNERALKRYRRKL